MFTVPNLFGAWQRIQDSAIPRGQPPGIEPTLERDPSLLGPPRWDRSPHRPSASEVGPSLRVPSAAQLYVHIRHHHSMLLFLFSWLYYLIPWLAGGLVWGSWYFRLHHSHHWADNLTWLYHDSRIQRAGRSQYLVSNDTGQCISCNSHQSGEFPHQ